MKIKSKISIFTSAINGCQSFAGLYAINVNVKKLVNPDRGLSTHNRPARSKCVEVNRQGSLVLKCFYSLISPVRPISVLRTETLKIVYKTGSLIVDADLGTNKQGGATSSLKPSDTMNDRQPTSLKQNNLFTSILHNGGKGETSFPSLFNFILSSRKFNFNSSIV